MVGLGTDLSTTFDSFMMFVIIRKLVDSTNVLDPS